MAFEAFLFPAGMAFGALWVAGCVTWLKRDAFTIAWLLILGAALALGFIAVTNM